MTKFMNQIRVINFNQGQFLHDKLYNNLIEVIPQRAFVDLEGNVTYYFKNNGEEFSIAGKDMELYKTRESYEKGDKPLEVCVLIVESNLRHTLSEHYILGAVRDEPEFLRMSSYSLVDGVPTEVDTPLFGFTIDLNMCFTPIFKSGVDIKQYFCAPERVLWFNEYKYTNENGKEIIQEGTRSFALLNDEQKKAVANLKKALDELDKAKVTATYCDDEGRWYFVPADKTVLEWEGAGDEKFLVNMVPEDQSFRYYFNDFYEAPTVYKRKVKS